MQNSRGPASFLSGEGVPADSFNQAGMVLGSVGGEACASDVASTSSDLLPYGAMSAISDESTVAEESRNGIQSFRTSEDITAWFMPRPGVVKPQYIFPPQAVRTMTDTATWIQRRANPGPERGL